MTLPKIIANIIINDLMKYSNRIGCSLADLGLTPQDISWLAMLIEYEVMDRTKVTKVIDEYMTTPNNVKDIITKLNLWPKYDNTNLEKIVDQVIEENQKAAKEIQEGNKKAVGF